MQGEALLRLGQSHEAHECLALGIESAENETTYPDDKRRKLGEGRAIRLASTASKALLV